MTTVASSHVSGAKMIQPASLSCPVEVRFTWNWTSPPFDVVPVKN